MSRSPLKANYTGRGIAAITGSVGGGHIERAAVAAEGYDPDDPAVVAALTRVSAVLAELGRRSGRSRLQLGCLAGSSDHFVVLGSVGLLDGDIPGLPATIRPVGPEKRPRDSCALQQFAHLIGSPQCRLSFRIGVSDHVVHRVGDQIPRHDQ
jgi:hypothetical protein